MEIKFWYSQAEHSLTVIHCPSGERRELKKTKKIEEFLRVYEIKLEDCKSLREDTDHVHLFKKMQVRK